MRKYALTAAAALPLVAALAAPVHAAPLAPLVAAPAGLAVQGQYIVTLKNGKSVSSTLSSSKVTAKHRFGKALNGFSAKLSAAQLTKLRANSAVASIEEDGIVTTTATQSNATWGIDRIDQRARPLSTTYTYTNTGAGVYAYVIDTGIAASHSQFGGRASNVYNAAGGSAADCNGHGTHVAGTIGSSTYGVAKQVNLRGVKVLNCSGSGTNSGVIAGINWVANNHQSPAVANMSLGGSYSSAVNNAVNNLANSGVFVAVAAGNSNANACNYSPASASNVVSVAASSSTDAKASFSNYGSCTHLYAPGVSITAPWLTGTNTISGTSMASPHVAGVAALYKQRYGNASYSTIRSWLTSNATPNVITGNRTGTPNRLLYTAGL